MALSVAAEIELDMDTPRFTLGDLHRLRAEVQQAIYGTCSPRNADTWVSVGGDVVGIVDAAFTAMIEPKLTNRERGLVDG